MRQPRAQRESGAASMDALNRGIQALQAESQGVLSVEVFTPEVFCSLLARAGGDAEARTLCQTVMDVVEQVKLPRAKPFLCGCCPAPIGDGRFSVVIARAAASAGGQGLSLLLCAACEASPKGPLSAAQTALQRIWPDARAITPHPRAGHA